MVSTKGQPPIWKQPIITVPLKIMKLVWLIVAWIGRKMWELSSSFAKGQRSFWGRKFRKWD